MASIKQQVDIVVHHAHVTVDLGGSLNAGTHMVVQTDLHALAGSNLGQLIVAIGHSLPLFIVEIRLFFEHPFGGALNAFALF
ncbi:hypothetical protein D3C71_1835250 [compost metagenome]